MSTQAPKLPETIDEVHDLILSGWRPAPKHLAMIKDRFGVTTEELYVTLYGAGTCKHCPEPTTFISFAKGFRMYCGTACANKDKDLSRTPEKNAIIQAKRRKTSLEKYGVTCNLMLHAKSSDENILGKGNTSDASIAAKAKRMATMQERYGAGSTPNPLMKNTDDLNEEFIKQNFVKNNRFSWEEATTYFNCSRSYFQRFDLPRRENRAEVYWHGILGGKRNDRTVLNGLELDIFNEEFQVALEFNGLAWHSAGRSDAKAFDTPDNAEFRKRHLSKTEMCEAKGIQLFHVFEDEFLDDRKRQIWTSVLNAKVKENTHRVFARKCKVVTISNSQAEKFCVDNHLQGWAAASVRYGLAYDGELVAVMTFGKSRYNKEYEYELVRFCSKLGVTVVGGASKLLNHFEVTMNPRSLISYANRRWSNGNLYRTLGFDLDKISAPNYWYFLPREGKLGSRVQFQKHKLKDKLEKFDPELSETENMFANGYRKIYDCGNLVFTKMY